MTKHSNDHISNFLSFQNQCWITYFLFLKTVATKISRENRFPLVTRSRPMH